MLQSADELLLPENYFDLAVSNMTMHHLDNEQLLRSLQGIHAALKPGGSVCIIDTYPGYDQELRAPKNENRWVDVASPWGARQLLFNHTAGVFETIGSDVGFVIEASGALPVEPAGQEADTKNYQKYTASPRRYYIKMRKDSD